MNQQTAFIKNHNLDINLLIWKNAHIILFNEKCMKTNYILYDRSCIILEFKGRKIMVIIIL